MLQINIPQREIFNEATSEFILTKGAVIQLEHSLVSLSKWESKWRKPFLSKENKTNEEVIDYIKCMTITQNVDPDIYSNLPDAIFYEINEYINAPMTATWFREDKGKTNKEIVTAEIIYYWMITQNIPMECQKWHLNRLLTLIRVCSIKNNPPKKRGKREMLEHRRAINEARKSQLNTKG